MTIDKRLIGEIANHIVGIQQVNPNILINRYKITRSRLDAIIEIFVEVKIVEFVSFTEPYKVLPKDKEEMASLLNNAYDVIDRRLKKPTTNNSKLKREDDAYINYLNEIREALIRIENKIDGIESPAKNMRLSRKFKKTK